MLLNSYLYEMDKYIISYIFKLTT